MNSTGNRHLAAFEVHRPTLFSLAYRMLGSATDAEDILQDAYLRFQGARLEDIQSPKAYLSAAVVRLCLNQLRSARAKREIYVGPWLPEPLLDAQHPELVNPEARAVEADSISLAFLVLLQRLTPAERAVFLLREVFEYEYAEIAAIFQRSEVACRQLFSRAREHIAAHRPRFDVDREQHRRLLSEFGHAVTNGDLHTLENLLADEATLWTDGGGKVPGAIRHPMRGRRHVARFLVGATARFAPPGAQFSVEDINGAPALLIRRADGTPFLVVAIDTERGQISTIWAIANPDKLTAM